jgi:hypothetical protein
MLSLHNQAETNFEAVGVTAEHAHTHLPFLSSAHRCRGPCTMRHRSQAPAWQPCRPRRCGRCRGEGATAGSGEARFTLTGEKAQRSSRSSKNHMGMAAHGSATSCSMQGRGCFSPQPVCVSVHHQGDALLQRLQQGAAAPGAHDAGRSRGVASGLGLTKTPSSLASLAARAASLPTSCL